MSLRGLLFSEGSWRAVDLGREEVREMRLEDKKGIIFEMQIKNIQ